MRARGGVVTVVLASVLLASTGCSFFRSDTEIIRINVEAGAEIFANGKSQGIVTQLELNRASDWTIRAMKDGRGAIGTVRKEVSTLGAIDTIIGYGFSWCLIGLPWLFGTFADGYWDLEPETITIALPAPKTATKLPGEGD